MQVLAKLRLDCGAQLSLLAAGGARQAMQDDDINALIGQLFALLTAKFEDGAGLAVEGQVPRPEQIPNLLGRVRTLARDATTLCDAIAVADASRS